MLPFLGRAFGIINGDDWAPNHSWGGSTFPVYFSDEATLSVPVRALDMCYTSSLAGNRGLDSVV